MAEDRTEWRIVRFGKNTHMIQRICIDGEDGDMQDYDSADWDGNLVYGSTVEKLRIDYEKMVEAFKHPMVRFATDSEIDEMKKNSKDNRCGNVIEIPKEEL